MFLFVSSIDENVSWYIDDNIANYINETVDTTDEDFVESNFMRCKILAVIMCTIMFYIRPLA